MYIYIVIYIEREYWVREEKERDVEKEREIIEKETLKTIPPLLLWKSFLAFPNQKINPSLD